jgi:hypothetical protein
LTLIDGPPRILVCEARDLAAAHEADALRLAPASIASIWFFGWRRPVVIAVVSLAGFLAEYVFGRFSKQGVTSSIFVTLPSLRALPAALDPAVDRRSRHRLRRGLRQDGLRGLRAQRLQSSPVGRVFVSSASPAP